VAKGTSGILTAEAREIGRSNKLLTYDVDICDENGKLLAHFTGMAYATHEENQF
jgi:acyl-coenzyme A thioesterase PaaI-like protein